MGRGKVGWLDPSLDSKNVGDQIIAESVQRVLMSLGLSMDQVIRLPTQRRLTRAERCRAVECDGFIVGGTNLLSSHLLRYRQWRLHPLDAKLYRQSVTLLGVGWWQYQGAPDIISSKVWGRILRPDGHSIRDAWSAQQLKRMGIESYRTSCPTMWELPEYPERSQVTGKRVVITLTDYNRNRASDKKLISTARANYEHVVAWPQGARDARYIKTLDPTVHVLPSGLSHLDDQLRGGSDYLGTRLHAGIRALQFGARSTVIEVDNRAREIGRDTGLPTVGRDEVGGTEAVFGERRVRLNIPHEEIDSWKRAAVGWLKC